MADIVERLQRKVDSVLGIETEAMNGDNLAVTLCSFFENPDQPVDDETGWTEDAQEAYEEIRAAIQDHFAPEIQSLRTQLKERDDAIARVVAQIEFGYAAPGKAEKCEHGVLGCQDCIACYDEALIRALNGDPS